MGLFSGDESNYYHEFIKTKKENDALTEYVDTLIGVLSELCASSTIDLAQIKETEAFQYTSFGTQADIMYNIESIVQDRENQKVMEEWNFKK